MSERNIPAWLELQKYMVAILGVIRTNKQHSAPAVCVYDKFEPGMRETRKQTGLDNWFGYTRQSQADSRRGIRKSL